MPPLRKPTPSYLLHKQSGRARAVWYDAVGVRQQKLLPGEFNSPESRTAFARLHLELEASPVPAVPDRQKLTIAELMLAYLDHAERHYCSADGKPTSELFEVKVVIRALRELYADTPVSEFGPLALGRVDSSFGSRCLIGGYSEINPECASHENRRISDDLAQ